MMDFDDDAADDAAEDSDNEVIEPPRVGRRQRLPDRARQMVQIISITSLAILLVTLRSLLVILSHLEGDCGAPIRPLT